MTTIEEFGERRYEVLVTLTIGLILLFVGVGFTLHYTPPCTQFEEGPICGQAPLYMGLIITSAGALLIAVGIVWAFVSRAEGDWAPPSRAKTK